MKYLYFILAGTTYLIFHEGVHIIQALIYGIYKGINLLPLGVEVEVIQPLTISGLKLAAFSGLSSISTVLTGYVLFLLSPIVLKSKKQYFKLQFSKILDEICPYTASDEVRNATQADFDDF